MIFAEKKYIYWKNIKNLREIKRSALQYILKSFSLWNCFLPSPALTSDSCQMFLFITGCLILSLGSLQRGRGEHKAESRMGGLMVSKHSQVSQLNLVGDLASTSVGCTMLGAERCYTDGQIHQIDWSQANKFKPAQHMDSHIYQPWKDFSPQTSSRFSQSETSQALRLFPSFSQIVS